MIRYVSLAVFLLLVVAASAMGGSFQAGEWYQQLNKPEWTPPDRAFGVVWAVLYLLMALAAWRIWLSRQSVRIGALIWWLIVLALNVGWSWIMFGLHRPGWALLCLTLVVAVAVMSWRAFMLLSRPAGLMLTPLVLWVAFAWYLNYTIWTMNRGGFGNLFGS